MMKFSIGYQLPDEYDSIGEIVQDYREHISSVYFSAPGQASARFAIDRAQEAEMFEELAWIRAQGVGMTLLFNANCYGALAVSAELRDQVVRTVENPEKAVGLTGVAHCIDNGPMEGFWGILKRERYYGHKFTDSESLVNMIEDYICYYNTVRLQRNLGILTPMEKHMQFYLAA